MTHDHIDPETEEIIEHPVSAEAEQEARLTPTEAIARMRINVPVRGNRKLRTLVERVNDDKQLKAWWHVSNVNAVARMGINDHSWVHIQIVTNIALKLLRQLTKHHVEPAMVTDYGMAPEDAEVVVMLASLTHCIGMSIHRHGHVARRLAGFGPVHLVDLGREQHRPQRGGLHLAVREPE